MEAILSLGSNLGDRRANLIAAYDALANLPDTQIVARAPLYETEPVDTPEAYRSLKYLNTVLVVETSLAPETLSTAIHDIEYRLGRRRGEERSLPRSIDIDLIACGDARRDKRELRLPHPQSMQRRFVLQPIVDVRPDLVLPGESRTIREQLASLPLLPDVVRATEQWE